MGSGYVVNIICCILYSLIIVCGFCISIPIFLVMKDFDQNCILFASRESYIVTYLFGSSRNCYFSAGVPLGGCLIFGIQFLIYHIRCLLDLRDNRMRNSTAFQYLSFFLNSLMAAMSLVAAILITFGFKDFCTAILSPLSPSWKCRDAQYWGPFQFKNGNFSSRSFYDYLLISEISCWIAVVLWFTVQLLLLCRLYRHRNTPLINAMI